jgi:hypothetical protein
VAIGPDDPAAPRLALPEPIFWVDSKQELAVVFMAQVPFATRVSYRRVIKKLVYAAITD